MKKAVVLMLFGAVMGCGNVFAEPPSPVPVSEQKVSLEQSDETLWTIFRDISRQTGVNFVLSPDIQDVRITVFVNDVSLEDALDAISNLAAIRYELRGRVYYLSEDTGSKH